MVEFIELTITLQAQAYSEDDSSAERFHLKDDSINVRIDTSRCRNRDALASRINEKITQVVLSKMEEQREKARRNAKRSNHETNAWKL